MKGKIVEDGGKRKRNTEGEREEAGGKRVEDVERYEGTRWEMKWERGVGKWREKERVDG